MPDRRDSPSLGGVTHYMTGEALVQIHFPEDDTVCKWCWVFLQCDNDLHRYRCKLTGEPIADPTHQIGQECPLIFKDKEGPPCSNSEF